MDSTAKLDLPFIQSLQAQKHVTHNEALKALDAIVQLSVLDRDLNTPPASPAEGDQYLVGASASGLWADKENFIAAWQIGHWEFYSPQIGWISWIVDEAMLVIWNGTVWSSISGNTPNPTPLVGINATADITTRLSINSPASLFNHEGSDHQIRINKNSASDTASMLYQTGYSGRAEMGLTGDDNFHFKVSGDGATWRDALLIDKDTGEISLPNTGGGANPNLLINGDGQINQRNFAGGVLSTAAFGYDRWFADGASANISISGYTWTLSSGTIAQKIEPEAWGHDDFASTTITLSVTGLSGGNLDVEIGSTSGTIVAGSGQRSVTMTTAGGDSGNLVVTLSPASGAVSFQNIKAEISSMATPYSARPLVQETALAQRYYECTNLSANERFAVGVVTNTSPGDCRFPLRFKQEKPSSSVSVTLSSTSHFSIDGPGYLDVADGFSSLTTSKGGCYVQFVNSVAQSGSFDVGGAILLGNTASAWIEFDGEI